ncbi:MAG TPA: hypothetical protein VLF59_02370 [Candidatus Saccharimonadales bacterium]|nr:hypothetical protein [Candidatus Saccharimonadales bacterium]
MKPTNKALQFEPRRQSWQVLTKVPQITVLFWVIKLLTTAMGEAASDYAVQRYNPYLTVLAGFMVFAVALIIQLRQQKYVPWAYWLAVAMVAVFGTMAADVLHIQLGIPYAATAVFFAVALAVIFAIWHRSEGTLSIHSVHTFKREAFYWLTVLTTFALGTATGDLTAISLHLGYLSSGLLFAVIFALPAIGYKVFRLNAVFAFWFAYIITRPFGASFADWIGKAKAVGGLGLGDGTVALVLALAIILLVGYVQLTGIDRQTKQLN